MIVIGCDFHPSFQQIAMLDTERGTTTDHKLMHASGEAERFYRALASPALVGIETVGNDRWFVQLSQRLGHEVWVGVIGLGIFEPKECQSPSGLKVRFFRKTTSLNPTPITPLRSRPSFFGCQPH